MNATNFSIRLFSLAVLCTTSFSFGYHLNSREKSIASNAIVDHIQTQINERDKQLQNMEEDFQQKAVDLQNNIIGQFQFACEGPNSFMIQNKVYLCIPAEAPQPNNDVEEYSHEKDKFII